MTPAPIRHRRHRRRRDNAHRFLRGPWFWLVLLAAVFAVVLYVAD